MKIVDVKAVLVRKDAGISASELHGSAPALDLVVLRVLTDEGVEGNSFAWGGRGGRTTLDIIDSVLKPALLGEDPLAREHIWQKIRSADRWWGLLPPYAQGPVDVALWDIAGKVANLPVYKMLGASRDKVRAYASSLVLPSAEAYVDQALASKERGYAGYKLHPWGDPRRDVAACVAVRKAVGDDYILMLDPVALYNHEQALRVGRAIEELDFYWYEEPLHDADIHGYIELTRALDIPVAGTEFLAGGPHSIPEYIVRHAVDIVRADVSWKGGITSVKKIASLCELFGVNCEIHTACYALLDVANLHVNCSITNCEFHEVLLPEAPFRFGVMHPPEVDREGYIQVPKGPGLGVDIDWEIIQKHAAAKI